MRKEWFVFVSFLIFLNKLSLLYVVTAQGSQPSQPKELSAIKVNSAPVIDGILDDSCWKVSAQATGFEDELLEQPTPDQTVAFLGYDAKNIYVAFHCYDAQPDKIVARERKDQVRPAGEDMAAFSIDTFHNHKFADRSFFIVNPLGTKFARIGGERAQKSEWIGLWEAKAKIVDDGWVTEMRIPWEILNYPSNKNNQDITMGINFDRRQQRTGIHSWWTNIGPQEFYEKEGHWIGVKPPPKRKDLLLLPFGYLGYLGTKESSEKHASIRSLSSQLGLDAKYPLTSGLILVGTLNPDFSNVEQAVEGIDFSYGERFVPDRRPFFQEGSSYYKWGFPGQYLHTRRISQVDMGLNLYGKLANATSLGMLGTFNRNGGNSLVLRGIQDLSTTSNVNLSWIGHYKTDTEENNQLNQLNHVLTLGESYRWKQISHSIDLAQSFLDGQSKGSNGNIFLSYNGTRLYMALVSFFVDPDFIDELGFFPFRDNRGVAGGIRLSNEWRKGIFRRGWIAPQVWYSDHYDGSLFQRIYSIRGSIETHSDYSLQIGWDGGRFEKHKDAVFNMELQGRVSDRFTNYGVKFSIGRRRSAPIRFINPSGSIRIGSLTTGVESQLLWYGGFQQQHTFTLNYDFSPEIGIAGRWVQRKEKNNFYIAFRRSGYAGLETFLIFGDPNAERFKRRLGAKAILPL